MVVYYMLLLVLAQWKSITQCSVTAFVLLMVEQYTSLLLIHVSEWYVQIVALLLMNILLILVLLRWIKWSIYQYQIALILHQEIIRLAYPQVIRELTTQTVQWTMLFRVLVLLSLIYPHFQAHTALSQTTWYPVAYA